MSSTTASLIKLSRAAIFIPTDSERAYVDKKFLTKHMDLHLLSFL